MKHKVWYDEKNQVVRLQVIGVYSSQEAEESGKLYKDVLEGKPYRQLIVDLSQSGEMESRETRKITNNYLKQAEFSDVAYFGANSTRRMIAKVLMKLSSLNIFSDFFKNEEEAINWLKSRRN